MEDQHLNDLLEAYSTVINRKETLSKQLSDLNKQEEYLEELIINNLKGQGLEEAGSQSISVWTKDEEYPNINDWDALWDYVVTNNVIDLIKHDINRTNWKKYQEIGIDFPGIKIFPKTKLNHRRKKGGV